MFLHMLRKKSQDGKYTERSRNALSEFRILFVIGFFPYDKESYFTIVRETAPRGKFSRVGAILFYLGGGGGGGDFLLHQ